MAKRQTRRSISVKGITHVRVKDFCDATGRSMSGYLEELLEEKMTEAGVMATPERIARALTGTYPTRKPEPDIVAQHFTF